MEIFHLFICADVQCTDNDAFTVHGGGNFSVRLELFIFCGIIACRQIEKFGTEQTDSLSIVVEYGGHVIGRADVAVNVNMLAVKGNILFAAHGVHEFFELLLFGVFLPELLNGNGVGFQNHFTGFAVQIDLTSLKFLIELVTQSADSRNAHGTRQNGGMSVAGAALKRKA